MKQAQAKRLLSWRPKVGIGPFEFGQPLPAGALEPGFGLELYENDKRFHTDRYNIAGTDAQVMVHYGLIKWVQCSDKFYLGQNNLIGMTPKEVKAIVDADWEEPLTPDENSCTRHDGESLGILLYEDEGRIVMVTVFRPYLWDWVPGERVGEIYFGAPMPKDTSLVLKQDEGWPNDHQSKHEIVLSGVTVDIDNETDFVTEVGLSDTMKYMGRELICRPASEVKKMIGGNWESFAMADPPWAWLEDDIGILLMLDGEKPDIVIGVSVWGDFTGREDD